MRRPGRAGWIATIRTDRRRAGAFAKNAHAAEDAMDVQALYRKGGQLEMERYFFSQQARSHVPDRERRQMIDRSFPGLR